MHTKSNKKFVTKLCILWKLWLNEGTEWVPKQELKYSNHDQGCLTNNAFCFTARSVLISKAAVHMSQVCRRRRTGRGGAAGGTHISRWRTCVQHALTKLCTTAPTRETQMQFQSLGFSLAQPGPLQPSGEWTSGWKSPSHFLTLSLCLSGKKANL